MSTIGINVIETDGSSGCPNVKKGTACAWNCRAPASIGTSQR